jgi:hypothetical protein
MLLPGGLPTSAGVQRDFTWKPLAGTVELAMAEAALDSDDVPAQVSATLVAALATLGAEPVTPERVDELSVGDRQFLMRRIAVRLDMNSLWLTATCRGCGADFDFRIENNALPVKPAGSGYPFVEVETQWGRCRLRLPSGADQRAVVGLVDTDEAMRVLVSRCLLTVDGQAPSPHVVFEPADLARIDQAMEAVAPEVATQAQAPCAKCGLVNPVSVDPYACLWQGGNEIYREVHTLAWYYHWSEEVILGMPTARRRRYLRLIDQARGMSQ